MIESNKKISREVSTRTQKLQAVHEQCSAQAQYNAAIQYAINEGFDGITFLRLWNEGAWDVIAREFPDFEGPDLTSVPSAEFIKMIFGSDDAKGEHPEFPLSKWIESVNSQQTTKGYWEWTHASLLEGHKGKSSN